MKAEDLIQQFSIYLTDNYSDLLVSENIEELIKKIMMEKDELVNTYGKLDIWLIYYFQQVVNIDLTENEKILFILWYPRCYDDISYKINYDTLTVSTLYEFMFYKINCKNVIVKNDTEIPNYCFANSEIENISIPNSVIYIRNYPFSNCTSLTSITIPDSVKYIFLNAFENCSSLTNITIGNGVKSIANGVFDKCNKLTSILIPDSVESIGDYVFNECNNLTSITIGNGVTHLGFAVFNDDYDYRKKLTIYTDNQYVRDYAEEEGIKWQPLNKN